MKCFCFSPELLIFVSPISVLREERLSCGIEFGLCATGSGRLGWWAQGRRQLPDNWYVHMTTAEWRGVPGGQTRRMKKRRTQARTNRISVHKRMHCWKEKGAASRWWNWWNVLAYESFMQWAYTGIHRENKSKTKKPRIYINLHFCI